MSWTSIQRHMTREQIETVIEEATRELAGLPLSESRDRQKMSRRVDEAVREIVKQMGLPTPNPNQKQMIQRQVLARVGGLGFLDSLLPPNRTDLTDVKINGDGALWIRRKGAMAFELHDEQYLSEREVWRAVESILAPEGRACAEATPSVDVKIPRDPEIDFGGARVKVIHPAIAPGEVPTIAIRLYEAKPVPPAQIVEWGVFPANVVQSLVEAVNDRLRVLIIGGTSTGKTTLLSAICHGIPDSASITTIEDPQEIWLKQPNVNALEARPAPPGSDVPPYTIADGVADALRLAPTHIIVGEVREGEAALSLFNALMTDHAGLTTFHAESPNDAVFRLAVLMASTEKRVQFRAGKGLFSLAIDLVVQVGWDPVTEQRRGVGVWEVEKGLQGGDVNFRTLWKPGDEEMKAPQRERA